jgi:hypothetical protein
MGKATLSITGKLETKIPYKNFLHKSLLRFYNYIFYIQQRRKYLDIGRLYIERIENQVRSLFNIMQKAV